MINKNNLEDSVLRVHRLYRLEGLSFEEVSEETGIEKEIVIAIIKKKKPFEHYPSVSELKIQF